MSRLEQALRRAGREDLSDAGVSAHAGDGVFSPAWDVEASGGERTSAAPVGRMESSVLAEEVPSVISGFSAAWGERLATGDEADRALLEQFRRLAGTLHQAQTANGLRSVMITSAAAGDGKTLTAVNLALVLSESYGRRVLLMDADLRRPSIPDVARVTASPGLSEALKAKTEQKLALVQLTERLALLPSGRPDPDPLGGLTSPRMRRILEEASARFDWVILDAPPVGPIADATLLAQMVDGALFVVRAGRTQHSMITSALDLLGRERIIGVVLNACEAVTPEQYSRYYGVSPDRA